MEPPAPRESCIIDYRESWPSPVASLSIETEAASISGSPTREREKERKKERKKEELSPKVVNHRKSGLLGFVRPKTIKLSISCIVNCCCIYESLLHCIASLRYSSFALTEFINSLVFPWCYR